MEADRQRWSARSPPRSIESEQHTCTAQTIESLKKNRPYQPNLEDYWRHMTTKQGRGVTQAVAFDAATVGGAWVGVWGSIGELGARYMCEVRFGSVLMGEARGSSM